jgi:beta-lactamase regulating signal transducer with metallopeptidase domain
MQSFAESPLLPLLLKSSWQASVLIVFVLGVRWIFGRHLRPQWRHALWLLVVVRLALPWTVPSRLSLFNYLHLPGAISASSAGVQSSPVAPESPRRQTSPVPAAFGGSIGSLLPWLLGIWLAGALGLAGYLFAAHRRLLGGVQARRPLIDAPVMNLLEDCKQEMGVYAPVTLVETAEVGSPSLFGFVRPRLLLPAGLAQSFSREELRHVFLHELGHIKRWDILLGWMMALLQILHWFNPLVWLAFHRMRVDRELACDALALSYAHENENLPYGRTIIKLLESFGRTAWAPSLAGTIENKNQLKERIAMIVKFQKTRHGLPLAAALGAVLGLITLTDAEAGGKASETSGSLEPPRIVETSPNPGATDVKATLKRITVTFNRDMEPGFSWTGGGPEFPEAPEGTKARWINKRTCELPVKLESAHFYRVGINSTSYQNFRSLAGVSALPTAIYFTTRGASEELKLKTQAPQVVCLEPLNGAQNVSPALTELRVTFNTSMGGGCSWCTVGRDDTGFPKGREGKQVYWTPDTKTCVLPVDLKPGQTYQLMLNSPGYINFQSAQGVPLEPVKYTFKTSAN